LSGGGAIFSNGTAKILADNCTFLSNQASDGGSFFVSSSSSIEVTNSYLLQNTAQIDGGAVYCTDNAVCSISSSLVELNAATSGRGGAIYHDQNSRIISQSNTYRSNEASYGGVHYSNQDSTSRFVSDSFIRNRALDNGGVAEITANGDVTWSQSFFFQNVASGIRGLLLRGLKVGLVDSCTFEGGLVGSSYGEPLVAALSASVTITNSTFRNSFSSEGGAVLVGGYIKSFLLEDSLFVDNTAFDKGALTIAGLSFADNNVSIVVRNTRFENNVAISSGGAIGGAGSSRENFQVRFVNCTVMRLLLPSC